MGRDGWAYPVLMVLVALNTTVGILTDSVHLLLLAVITVLVAREVRQ